MDREQSSALLSRARHGSRDAIDTLFEGVAGRVLAIIRLRLGPGLRSQLESRDILQATLLKAFERLEQFEGEKTANLVGWLARIAENEIRQQAEFHGRGRRDVARRVALEEAGDLPIEEVHSAISRLVIEEEMARLERALERLKESHREVILLRKLEGLSFSEIGERLGKSTDACRMQLVRALAALTLVLEEMVLDEGTATEGEG